MPLFLSQITFLILKVSKSHGKSPFRASQRMGRRLRHGTVAPHLNRFTSIVLMQPSSLYLIHSRQSTYLDRIKEAIKEGNTSTVRIVDVTVGVEEVNMVEEWWVEEHTNVFFHTSNY